jgi:uncharacterized membrane protein YedE/YeeE
LIVGIALAPALAHGLWGQTSPVFSASSPLLILSGALVGFGSRLGSGCTSGHGVCGIARLSPRSMAATFVFIAAAFATTFVVRRLLA